MSVTSEGFRSLQPGTIIGQRYEVVRCLGQGSMGLVYACRHTELGHMVAVKVLFPEVAEDKIAAARFRNEIFASYGISHPNVVRAYEYLRDGEIIAYTMEYVNGGDLADILAESEKLDIETITQILSQICAGVQAIHDAGIVHRDLKPENILLTDRKHVKIADFGIARLDHGPKLTEHGGVVGTIDYVAPEYMLESKVDWRSDIYAIGILGYEMIAGVSPYRGESVYATMTLRLKTDPEVPSSHNSKCPEDLNKIILKAMSRNPELRYQSASEMFYDLQLLAPETDSFKSGAFVHVPPKAKKDYKGPEVDAELTASGQFVINEVSETDEYFDEEVSFEGQGEVAQYEDQRTVISKPLSAQVNKVAGVLERSNNIPDLLIPNLDIGDTSKTVALRARPDTSMYDFGDEDGYAQAVSEPIYAEVIDIQSYYSERTRRVPITRNVLSEEAESGTLVGNDRTFTEDIQFAKFTKKKEVPDTVQSIEDTYNFDTARTKSLLARINDSTVVEYLMITLATLIGITIALFVLFKSFFPHINIENIFPI